MVVLFKNLTNFFETFGMSLNVFVVPEYFKKNWSKLVQKDATEK